MTVFPFSLLFSFFISPSILRKKRERGRERRRKRFSNCKRETLLFATANTSGNKAWGSGRNERVRMIKASRYIGVKNRVGVGIGASQCGAVAAGRQMIQNPVGSSGGGGVAKAGGGGQRVQP